MGVGIVGLERRLVAFVEANAVVLIGVDMEDCGVVGVDGIFKIIICNINIKLCFC